MEVFGTVGSMKMIDFQGKTDPLILKESLSHMGFSEDEIFLKTESLKERYFFHLRDNISKFKTILHPGIRELLDSLSAASGIYIGLLTGNFKVSAEIKLSRFDLNSYFGFGVFGDDAGIRNDMPPIARQRVLEHYSLDIPFERIYIIGDTVYDIECAQTNGAVSIAVGTGWGDTMRLKSMSPDYFFQDMGDTDLVMKAITG